MGKVPEELSIHKAKRKGPKPLSNTAIKTTAYGVPGEPKIPLGSENPNEYLSRAL